MDVATAGCGKVFVILKRVAVWAISIVIAGVFALFAINFYLNYTRGPDDPDRKPTIIFEKPGRAPAA